jgi:hypothetical protein
VPANTYQWCWSLKSSMHALTIVPYIGANMRTCRGGHTAAWVGTRGMPVVAQTRMMRDPREGRRRQRSKWTRSISRLLRMREKKVTCRGKVLHCQCGTYPWLIDCVRYSRT